LDVHSWLLHLASLSKRLRERELTATSLLPFPCSLRSQTSGLTSWRRGAALAQVKRLSALNQTFTLSKLEFGSEAGSLRIAVAKDRDYGLEKA